MREDYRIENPKKKEFKKIIRLKFTSYREFHL